MKILNGFCVTAALLMAGVAMPSFATSLTNGGTVTPTTVAGNFFSNFTILGNTGPVAYNAGGDSGTIQEWVGTWSANPIAADAGDMVFVYQVTITGGDAARVTGGSYAGFTTDVFDNIDGSGTTAPSDATRSSTGVVVGFDFNPNLLPTATSYLLIVDTNAKSFTTGPDSVIDDTTFTNNSAFAPANTPEPSSLALLGTGLLGAAGIARRRFFRK